MVYRFGYLIKFILVKIIYNEKAIKPLGKSRYVLLGVLLESSELSHTARNENKRTIEQRNISKRFSMSLNAGSNKHIHTNINTYATLADRKGMKNYYWYFHCHLFLNSVEKKNIPIVCVYLHVTLNCTTRPDHPK